jgi:hypothetical protein
MLEDPVEHPHRGRHAAHAIVRANLHHPNDFQNALQYRSHKNDTVAATDGCPCQKRDVGHFRTTIRRSARDRSSPHLDARSLKTKVWQLYSSCLIDPREQLPHLVE